MEPWLLAIAALLIVIAAAGLALTHGRGRGTAFNAAHRPSHRDADMHARRAAAEAEMEEHDVDDMLDAIVERRRARGRPEIGDELARRLLREADED